MVLPVINRLGQSNGSGSDLTLFLKKYGGEVLTAYERAIKVSGVVNRKFATNGKSAQFPATGLASAKHYVAGDSLYLDSQSGGSGNYLQKINAAEIEIFVDRPLIAGPIAIDSWDEMVNHYDVRAPYAGQLAQALAKTIDTRCIIAGILGARQVTATVTGLPLGASNFNADGSASSKSGGANGNTGASTALLTDGAAILNALFQAAVRFDMNDVPEDGRYVVLDPTQYAALVQNATVLNRDFGGQGNGVFFDNKVYRAAGFILLKTNSIPRAANAAVVGANNSYTLANGGATGGAAVAGCKTAMLCFHSSAIGLVSWREMVMQADIGNVEYQSDIVLAKLSCGVKWLRPEALFEITVG